MVADVVRRLLAEGLGTLVLVAAIVGSGIMAQSLTDDVGIQLLLNMVSTILALGLLIWTFGPVSGAHFNPAVTGVALVRREMPLREGGGYVLAQVMGGAAGAVLANLMYALPAVELSNTDRSGANLLLGEVVATAGLLWVIGALTRAHHGHLGPVLVPAWIGSAYIFTSSTSFANPAVTVGRMFTDTFAGIAPASVPPFLLAQVLGATLGALATGYFHPRQAQTPEPLDLPDPVHTPPEEHP